MANLLRSSIFFLMLLFGFQQNAKADIPDSLQNLLDKAGSDTARIRILLKAADRMGSPDPVKAEEYAQKALSLSQKSGSQALIARSYYTLGTAAYVNKTFQQSHAYFLKALTMFESLHDTYFTASCYSAIGDVLGDEGNGRKGIEYYQKAKTNYLSLKDSVLAVYMDMSIAGTLGMMNMLDSSLSYSLTTLPSAQKIKDKGLISKITSNIAAIYRMKGDKKQALNYFFQTLPYFQEDNDPVELGQAYYSIGSVYYDMQDYEPALKYALLGYKEYEKVRSLSNMVNGSRQIAATYACLKNYEKATGWYAKAADMSDTLHSKDMASQVAEMQSKYESEKKDQLLRLQKSELTRQQFIIYGSLAFGLLILLVFIVLYVNFRKTNRLGKELAVQKEKLQDLNSVKDKLFSIISHDLRSPMGSLRNMAKLLRSQALSPEKISDFSARMDRTLEKTMQLMDNLLHWATLQIMERDTQEEELVLADVIGEALDSVREDALQKNVSLEEDIDFDQNVLADENTLLLVLRNLLTNAVKFTPAGGKVLVSSSVSGKKVTISVKDSGIGMDENTLKMLQGESVSISTKGTEKEKGYGLGLQLCKEYVRKWGGELQIESRPGEGSRFSFSVAAAER